MSGFAQLGLCNELLETLITLDHKVPTPVQMQAIPAVLAGRDLVAEAQTGTGKTASFALPIIQRLYQAKASHATLATHQLNASEDHQYEAHNQETELKQTSQDTPPAEYRQIRGLVLTPTRELAMQVADDTLEYGKLLKMRVISIYGGVRFDNQVRKLKRGADILVATPGRLLDLIRHKEISLECVEILVFDEADRMLDLGFIDDIRKLLDFIPPKRQTLLFSATLNDSVEVLAEKLLQNPYRVAIEARNSASKQVKQSLYAVEREDKADVLAFLIKNGNWQQTLVFTRTKKGADQLTHELRDEGITAVAIHGDRSQRDRIAALKRFTDGEVQVLVATDVAARGLHIEALPQVVNYDVPNQPEAYVHRIGRTGRAGLKGHAVSLVAGDERRFLQAIADLISRPMQLQPVPTLENGRLVEGGFLSLKRQAKSKKGRNQDTRSPSKDSVKSSATGPNKSRAGTKPQQEQEETGRPSIRPSLFGK